MKSLKHRLKFFFAKRTWDQEELEKETTFTRYAKKNEYSEEEKQDILGLIKDQIKKLRLESRKPKLMEKRIIEIEAQIDILSWLGKEIYGST